MPALITETQITADVEGEDLLDHLNNPDAKKFRPAWCQVTLYGDGQLLIVVKGPVSNQQGKDMKTWGLSTYDADDIKDETAPPWLIDLVKVLD